MNDPLPSLRKLAAALSGTPRKGQDDLAKAASRAFSEGGRLVSEAGTGTGKTFGYLVPAVMSGSRTLVVTSGLALQDQIIAKDLPLIRDVIDPSLTFAALKGKSNYACVQRAREIIGFRARGARRSAAEWAISDETSRERNAAPFEIDDALWRDLTVGSDECPGASVCISGRQCAAVAARKAALEARVVVTNMHLFGIWIANDGLPEPVDADGNPIPEGRFGNIIIDEAHDLDHVACSVNGVSLTARQLRHLGDELLAAGQASGRSLRACSAAFERECDRIGSARFDTVASEPALESILVEAASLIGAVSHTDNGPGQRLQTRCENVEQAIATVVSASPDIAVTWCDNGRLTSQPKTMAAALARNAWDRRGVVVVSATVPRKIISDVGLKLRPNGDKLAADVEVAQLKCETPFDYTKQGVLYLPTHLPRPGAPGWDEASVEECLRIVEVTGGGAIVLCTSMAAVTRFAGRLSAAGYTTFAQGPGVSKERLVENFAADHDSVLVGTRSFWQGVDVPGSSLRAVVIDRVPFPRPDDWPVEARREMAAERFLAANPRLEWDEAKKMAFNDVDVPLAATALAQAAGRLIRSTADCGVVAVLDNRLSFARYGSTLLNRLPPMYRTSDFDALKAAVKKMSLV